MKIKPNYTRIEEIRAINPFVANELLHTIRHFCDASNHVINESQRLIASTNRIIDDMNRGYSPETAIKFVSLDHLHQEHAKYETATSIIQHLLYNYNALLGIEIDFAELTLKSEEN